MYSPQFSPPKDAERGDAKRDFAALAAILVLYEEA